MSATDKVKELIGYLSEQYPATKGNLPLVQKIGAIYAQGLADREQALHDELVARSVQGLLSCINVQIPRGTQRQDVIDGIVKTAFDVADAVIAKRAEKAAE